jgi:hypothetical protein
MIPTTALDFYNRNKDCLWTPKPIPKRFINDVQRAKWILNESDFGWLKLDINIDLGGWQLEAEQADPYFVDHREDESKGWTSCCLHGISVDKTGAWTNYGYTSEKDVPYQWTELGHKSPRVTHFWKNQFPTENYRRIRFMQLDSNSAITPHSDMPGRLPGEENFDALDFGVPINIAVIHPQDCHMVLEGYGIVPFEEGSAFIVNIRNYHSVVNFSNKKRIHVIGHSYGYGKQLIDFAQLVVRSYNKQCKVI